MSDKAKFMEAVLGVDGARALAKASANKVLSDFLFPRVMISWVDAIEASTVDKPIPGIKNSKLAFCKTDSLYTGVIFYKNEMYELDSITNYQLAGALAILIGGPVDLSVPIAGIQALKLAKSIDTLVKMVKPGAENKLPDLNAQPIGPVEPVKTQAEAKPGPGTVGTQASSGKVGTSSKTVALRSGARVAPPKKGLAKLPGMGDAIEYPNEHAEKIAQNRISGDDKVPSASGGGASPGKQKAVVSPMATTKSCQDCGLKFFKAEKYVGCLCLSDLAKHVKTVKADSGLVLEFGKALDEDAILTIINGVFDE